MRDPAPRAPFDQGLFLTHFNKGKALFGEKKLAEAERELEEAYLLRPRDQSVLNLLGLVYFKQEKLEKAEEVYRKLAAESPEVPTLYYNLGLIHFKLNRLEEAESAFLKALELSRENPKINFYLGSVYERLQRFQDAIYQYRQAGANLMVRRVEDKLAAGGPAAGGQEPSTAPDAPATLRMRPPAATPATPVTAGGPAAPSAREAAPDSGPAPPVLEAPAVRPKKPDDTAEFKVSEIHEAIRRRHEEALAAAQKVVQPVSKGLLAEGAAPAKPGRGRTDDTARFAGPVMAPETPDLLAPGAGGSGGSRATDTFRFLQNNLMEIEFSGKVYIKQGTIYSYGGNLTFWVKEARPDGQPSLVIVTGSGRLILTDRDREITFMHVANETIYVQPAHLLACEETLSPRYVGVGGGAAPLSFLLLEGRGMVALSVVRKPLALPVTPELPVSVPASSVIMWNGSLTPQLVDDRQIFQVMLPAAGGAPALLRLEGIGRLLVEQSG